MPYRVLFITAEYAPFAKTGGLADVSTALTRYLHRRGDDVRVFMPYYRQVAAANLVLWPVDFLQDLKLVLGEHRYRYRVLTGTALGGVMTLPAAWLAGRAAGIDFDAMAGSGALLPPGALPGEPDQ